VEQSFLATKLADDAGGATPLDHNTAAARISKIINIRVNVNFMSFSFRMLAHYPGSAG